MADRWVYTKAGQPAFYQQGEYLYAAQGGTAEYFQRDDYFHPMKGGNDWLHLSGKWLYSKSGEALYYFSD